MVNQGSHAERWVETSSPENLKKSLYENQYWMFVIFRLTFRIASQISSSAHRHFAAGPVFGNMNQFTGLGVFLDTYPNVDKSYDVSVLLYMTAVHVSITGHHVSLLSCVPLECQRTQHGTQVASEPAESFSFPPGRRHHVISCCSPVSTHRLLLCATV